MIIVWIIVLIVLALAVHYWLLHSQRNDGYTDQPYLLTFDDGPHPTYTLQIAQYLRSCGLPAIFFVIGENVEHYPNIISELDRLGFEIGVHGYSHNHHVIRGYSHNRDSFQRTKELVEGITGKPVRYYRPPYGQRNIFTVHAGRDCGLRHVGWNCLARDWEPNTNEQMIANVDKTFTPGSIVLLHDVHKRTVDLLPQLITHLNDL